MDSSELEKNNQKEQKKEEENRPEQQENKIELQGEEKKISKLNEQLSSSQNKQLGNDIEQVSEDKNNQQQKKQEEEADNNVNNQNKSEEIVRPVEIEKQAKEQQIVEKQQQKKKDQAFSMDNIIKEKQESTEKKENEKQIKQQKSSEKVQERPITMKLGKQYFTMAQKQPLQLTDMDVFIQIVGSQQKGFALGKHTHHHVVGKDKHGPIDIIRKTSQFESLRKILLERWPGCFIPPISDRSDTKTEQLKKLHKRKNLQNFLMKIARSEFIYYKQQVQLFLRSEGIDMSEMFGQMPVLKVRHVMERFESSFDQQQLKKNSLPEISSKISKFSTNLKKIANNLGNLAKKSLKLAESYEVYSNKLPKFGQIATDYQKLCLTQYSNHNPSSCVILNDSSQKIKKLQTMKQNGNIFYDLYFLLESQTRDAECLSEIILAMQMFNIKRDDLDMKSKETRLEIDQICLGHKNIKVMTSRKTKQQVQAQLEQKQKQIINDRHLISELAAVSESILCTNTIEIFKKMKKQAYLVILKIWVQVVGEVNSQIYELWKFLADQSSHLIAKQ